MKDEVSRMKDEEEDLHGHPLYLAEGKAFMECAAAAALCFRPRLPADQKKDERILP
ncbi:MAG: hypothetical protein JXQ27_09165 [Acidobacteria bacterium]|nr:hypothetical protein [Acidobacteriota bacterium]